MLVSVALFFLSSPSACLQASALRAVTARICQALFVLSTRHQMQLKRIRFDVFHICTWAASLLFGSFGRLIFSEFLFIFGFLFGLSTRSRTLKETREADGGSCKTSIASLWRGHAFFLLGLVQVWQESIDSRRLWGARSQGGFHAEAAAIQEIAGKGEKLVELISGME